jgi:hypothetical protein
MESGIGHLQDLDMLLLSSLILRICCNQSKVADCWAASAAAAAAAVSDCNRDRGVLGMCVASCVQGTMYSKVVTERDRETERHTHTCTQSNGKLLDLRVSRDAVFELHVLLAAGTLCWSKEGIIIKAARLPLM